MRRSDFMVIKINKIHIFVLALILVSVSFIFTLLSEPVVKKTSVEQGISLPIIMYHHVTENPDKAGKYVVTTKELENDFKYIKEKGYRTVTVNDMIKYINGEIQLPEKIIMITFDDGFKSVYKLALPILEKYNIKAVVAPIGIVTEEYTKNQNTDINYSYMTWEELRKISESTYVEVQNHTYNMHNLSKDNKSRSGMKKMINESAVEYKEALKYDLTKMQQLLLEKSKISSDAIMYPYGLYSKDTLDIIKELGFRCNFLCEEKINFIRAGEPDSLYNLGRFNRPSGTSTATFFSKMKIQ